MPTRPARHDVVVVGAGPNGLAAAVTLARAGLSVHVVEAQPTPGGGARTVEGLLPGVVHDLCSAVHPMASASPFFRRFDLAGRGVELVVPEISYAHPLDSGGPGLAHRSLAATAAGLGRDGQAWVDLLGPLAAHADDLVAAVLGDHRHLPPGPVTAARLALRVLEQGTTAGWGRRFREPVAPALLTGVAAHAITPLPSLAAAGTALLLGTLAHARGWGVPRGGTGAITAALLADLGDHGGTVELGRAVLDPGDLPPSRALVLDTTPTTAARILADRMPTRHTRAFRRFRYGPGAAKVDFVLSGPVPWRDAAVGRAGTVHLGGRREEVAAAERSVARGEHSRRPVVLLSDPAVSDPGRVGPDGRRPLWTYAHVPAGSTADMTEAVTAQVERFAPGFRDVVVAARCIPAARMADHDASYVGGDIASGAVGMRRVLSGPMVQADPLSTGVPGAYLCSASVPPGPGVHGMGGWHAARRVLRDLGLPVPDLSPGR